MEINKQRCADLEARGLMTEAGRKALAEERNKRQQRQHCAQINILARSKR